MKRIRLLTLIAIIAALNLMSLVPSFAADTGKDAWKESPSIDATSAIIMNADSGEVLFEKNAYEKRDPASITKVLNCMVVLEKLDMDEEISIDFEPTNEGSIMGLEKGERIKIRDLVYAMMVWSANDAAEVLAIEAAGDIQSFCEMMNDKAVECGATNTKYTNPNGLNPRGKVNNVSTAYDIALIASEAMKNEKFAKIVGSPKLEIAKTNKSKKRKHHSSNRCLWDDKTPVELDFKYINETDNTDYLTEAKRKPKENEDTYEVKPLPGVDLFGKYALKYKGCVGIKTGYSSSAGDCFVGMAERGETRLIVVVLNASHEIPKFIDTINLWNYAFANFKSYTAATKEEVQAELAVKNGNLAAVDLGLRDDFVVTIPKGENGDDYVRCELSFESNELVAPVEKGSELGKLVAYDSDGKELNSQKLYALESVEIGGPLSKYGIADEELPLYLLIAIALVTVVIIGIVISLQRKQKRAMETAK